MSDTAKRLTAEELATIKCHLMLIPWDCLAGEYIRKVFAHIAAQDETIAWLEGERDKLQAFKQYVHDWLDKAGVDPHHECDATGACRIGLRLTDVLAARPAADPYTPTLRQACVKAKAHVEELREAWRSGALHDCDGKGGERSNRNVDVDVALRKALETGGLVPAASGE